MDGLETPQERLADEFGPQRRPGIALASAGRQQPMVTRLAYSLLRALLVVILIATPSLVLPDVAAETGEIVVILAILAAVLTFMEYYSHSPSVIEFRFAPPFNRIKFAALFAIVFLLSITCACNDEPTRLGAILAFVGTKLGAAVDFPYSPVRMMVLMLPNGAEAGLVGAVRTAAGIAYTMSLVCVFVFLTHVRFRGWPARNGVFNVWINLPRFDATAGGDVLHRMKRDAGLNIVIGALLPFLIPASVRATSIMGDAVSLSDPQTMIWIVSAWAFLPASMIMRGIAMSRIAEMIEAKRRRAYARSDDDTEARTARKKWMQTA